MHPKGEPRVTSVYGTRAFPALKKRAVLQKITEHYGVLLAVKAHLLMRFDNLTPSIGAESPARILPDQIPDQVVCRPWLPVILTLLTSDRSLFAAMGEYYHSNLYSQAL